MLLNIRIVSLVLNGYRRRNLGTYADKNSHRLWWLSYQLAGMALVCILSGLMLQLDEMMLTPGLLLWVSLFPLALFVARRPRLGGRQWRSAMLRRVRAVGVAQVAVGVIFAVAAWLASYPLQREIAAYLMVACPAAWTLTGIALCTWVRWCACRYRKERGAVLLIRMLPDVVILACGGFAAAVHVRAATTGARFESGEEWWPLMVLAMLLALAAGRLFLVLGRPNRARAQLNWGRAPAVAAFVLSLWWLGAIVIFPYQQPTKYPDHRMLGWDGLAESLLGDWGKLGNPGTR
jgi:hypothetical protein